MSIGLRNRLAGTAISFVFITLGAAQNATVAVSGTFDGPAELPRMQVKSSLADTPAPGKVRTIRAGDNLEDALKDSACGDTLKLEAGAVFSGHFTFPEKHCDDGHW